MLHLSSYLLTTNMLVFYGILKHYNKIYNVANINLISFFSFINKQADVHLKTLFGKTDNLFYSFVGNLQHY